MNSWWVNHKQTAKQELAGGYIWSPHRDSDGKFNQTYLNLTLVERGDLIFSFSDTKIKAIGIALSSVENAPKPEEFGNAGANWNDSGYLVRVSFGYLNQPFRPKQHIHELAALLPKKYSPIRATGDGNQKCYLANISRQLSDRIIDLMGESADELLEGIVIPIDDADREATTGELKTTEKLQLVLSRRGQGLFRQNVSELETACRITGVSDKRLLRASHIKPWRLSNNKERLDGANGLLLSPHVDHLFDKGFISFTDHGQILISEDIESMVLNLWKIDTLANVGSFNNKQKPYLAFHRSVIFRSYV